VRLKPPEWLVSERVLGSVGLGAGDGKGWEAYVERRVLELGMKAGRKELEVAWKALRRGWYVGEENFKLGLLARAKELLLGKRRESCAGAAQHAHDQRQAERMLQLGTGRLGLRPGELARMTKGQRAKQVLAWWLHGPTTVTRRWIAEKLRMGYETRVSQAVSRVETSHAREVIEMKKRLTEPRA